MKMFLTLVVFIFIAGAVSADETSEYNQYLAKRSLTADQFLVIQGVGKGVFGPKEPATLPNISEMGFTWSDWLKVHLSAVVAEPVNYRNHGEPMQRKSIALVYGVFSLGNFSDPFLRLTGRSNNKWGQLAFLLKSEKAQDALIEWAVGNFQHVYEDLPHEDRRTYDEILTHAISYLKKVDLSTEEKHLKKVRDKGEQWLFTSYDPRGNASPYRKLECMLYRRIANGDFSRERLLTIALRIQESMANWLR